MPRRLHHSLPDTIDVSHHHFYVTQCALPRSTKILLTHADELKSCIEFYHQTHKWFCRAFVIMPDHIHLLISPFPETSLSKLMQDWKRYTAKQFQIQWQESFFEHRLRSDESATDKASYMELNPVRARLVEKSIAWKWFGYFEQPVVGHNGLPNDSRSN
jgi:putative transposase